MRDRDGSRIPTRCRCTFCTWAWPNVVTAGADRHQRLPCQCEPRHHVGMPERAPTPTPERRPAWRAACLAYREQRRAGATDHAAWFAAVGPSGGLASAGDGDASTNTRKGSGTACEASRLKTCGTGIARRNNHVSQGPPSAALRTVRSACDCADMHIHGVRLLMERLPWRARSRCGRFGLRPLRRGGGHGQINHSQGHSGSQSD